MPGLTGKRTELNFLANGSNRQAGELTLSTNSATGGRNPSLISGYLGSAATGLQTNQEKLHRTCFHLTLKGTSAIETVIRVQVAAECLFLLSSLELNRVMSFFTSFDDITTS